MVKKHRSVRPDEDRDVIVQFVGSIATDRGHRELWTVWVQDVRLFECIGRELAIEQARGEAQSRRVRAWLLDERGYPPKQL